MRLLLVINECQYDILLHNHLKNQTQISNMGSIASIFDDANEFIIEGLLFSLTYLLIILTFCLILHAFISASPIAAAVPNAISVSYQVLFHFFYLLLIHLIFVVSLRSAFDIIHRRLSLLVLCRSGCKNLIICSHFCYNLCM